jgi:Spx/MgsR family transcriptional regulator
MYTLYGIPNCNSVKKARTWLEAHNIAYHFHDYKKEGVTRSKLTQWCRQVGWQSLLNQNGTTWRALDDSIKTSVANQSGAIALMAEHTSVIKRPVIEQDDKIVVIRFDEVKYEELFL